MLHALFIRWRILWLRVLLWGVNGDLACLEAQAQRVAEDRIAWARRRSDLIIEIINLEEQQ